MDRLSLAPDEVGFPKELERSKFEVSATPLDLGKPLLRQVEFDEYILWMAGITSVGVIAFGLGARILGY